MPNAGALRGSALLGVCIVVALGSACGGKGDLHFSIQFNQPGGLAVGDMVLLEGAAVGRVVNVEPSDPVGVVVDVRVFKEFRGRLRKGSSFSVRRSLPGIGARPRIEIEIQDASSEPIDRGFRAEGSP